jgi:integrase
MLVRCMSDRPTTSDPARASVSRYAEAGVDIEKKYAAVDLATAAIRRTFTKGVVGDVGLFGGLFDPARMGFADALLVEAVWARHEAERALCGTPTHQGYEELVRDRQVLYWFTLTTAFRANECASIRWEDLTLTGNKLAVRLSGQFTKNGDDALVPLQPFVAEALKQMRDRRSAVQMRRGTGPVQETDLVFHVPSKIAEIVRKDAAFAGLIPQRGVTSRRVDFHCLRKSCARILIELNVHPKVIQQTLRHADIRLTMDLYGELGEDDLFRELPGKFPVPKMFTGPRTATDSASA